jgi:hypothetical protein
MAREIAGAVEQIGQFGASGWALERSGDVIRLAVELDRRRYEPDTRWDSRRTPSATAAPAAGGLRFTVAFAPSGMVRTQR